jgi:hypothetical protein
MCNTSSQQLRGQILCPWLGDIVNYGIGLSTISPSQGRRTRPLVICCGVQVRCCCAEAGEPSALCPAHRPHLPATCRPRPWGPSQFPIGIFPFICSLRLLACCKETFPVEYPGKKFFRGFVYEEDHLSFFIDGNMKIFSLIFIYGNILFCSFSFYNTTTSVADPGSGAFLKPGSGIQDG